MTNKLITSGLIASLVLATAGTAAVAAQSEDVTAAITEEQAIQFALAEVTGEVQEAELDSEDGKAVYEIEILTADGTEMEVEIDGDTGAVLKAEAEDADDEDDGENDKDDVDNDDA